MGQSQPSGATPSGGRVSHAASHLASRASGGKDGEVEDAEPHEVDVLASASWEQVLAQVSNVKVPDPSVVPAKQVLLDVRRQEIEPDQLSPSAVFLHVYDVEEDLRAMNHFLAFSMEDVALGGAFHAGVEVFGNEWSYGALGVQADPPRSIEGHAYRCSILLGQTELTPEQVATELVQLCQVWRGKDYDMLDKNCCSFATRLCTALGVSPMPPWVDRFARMLRQGRTAGRGVLKAGQYLLGDFAPEVSRMLGSAGGQQQLLKGGARPADGDPKQRNSVSVPLQPPVVDLAETLTPSFVSEASDASTESEDLVAAEASLVEPLPMYEIGELVEYDSESQGCAVQARVVAFNAHFGTYDLDRRHGVPPEKIRRLAAAASRHEECYSAMASGGGMGAHSQELAPPGVALAVEEPQGYLASAGVQAPEFGGAQGFQLLAAIADADAGHGLQPFAAGAEAQHERGAHGG